MLIAYALLIFALCPSVVAPFPPPAHQPQEEASGLRPGWEVLEGNKDLRLINPDPELVYRWYKLKYMETKTDYPTWSKNKNLDQVIQFINITDGGGVEQVSIFRLHRQLYQRINEYEYHQTRYAFKKTGRRPRPLDDLINLKGFWGRALELEKSANDLRSPPVPVVIFDMVIMIEKPNVQWEWSFVDYALINYSTHGFMSALTWYRLSKQEVECLLREAPKRKITVIPIQAANKPIKLARRPKVVPGDRARYWG